MHKATVETMMMMMTMIIIHRYRCTLGVGTDDCVAAIAASPWNDKM